MLRVWRLLERGWAKASQINELRRTAKWHDPREEVREEDDLLTGEELKLFQSVAARFNILPMDRPGLTGPLVLSKRADAKNGFTAYTGLDRTSRELHDAQSYARE